MLFRSYEAAALLLMSSQKRLLPLPYVCEALCERRRLHCAAPYYNTSEKSIVYKIPYVQVPHSHLLSR